MEYDCTICERETGIDGCGVICDRCLSILRKSHNDIAAIIAEFGSVEECVRLAKLGQKYDYSGKPDFAKELEKLCPTPKGESDGEAKGI